MTRKKGICGNAQCLTKSIVDIWGFALNATLICYTCQLSFFTSHHMRNTSNAAITFWSAIISALWHSKASNYISRISDVLMVIALSAGAATDAPLDQRCV